LRFNLNDSSSFSNLIESIEVQKRLRVSVQWNELKCSKAPKVLFWEDINKTFNSKVLQILKWIINQQLN
jgi:hypothetical protein